MLFYFIPFDDDGDFGIFSEKDIKEIEQDDHSSNESEIEQEGHSLI